MQCLCDKGQYGVRCNAPLSNDETHELLLCAKDFNGEHNSNIQLECDADATISILYANIGRTRRYSRCSPEDVFDYYPIQCINSQLYVKALEICTDQSTCQISLAKLSKTKDCRPASHNFIEIKYTCRKNQRSIINPITLFFL